MVDMVDAVKSQNHPTLLNIQALRGLAATLVIFVHLHYILGSIGVKTFGGGGVDLFFVISGYIMVFSTFRKDVSSLTFFRNRVIRIVPIYWLVTLAVFAIAVLAPRLLQNTEADPIFLAKSLLFIPFYKSPGHLQPILFVGWTLNYEMFFYLIFALGLQFKETRHRLLFTVGMLSALCLIGVIAASENVLFQFYTSPLLLEFSFGMLIAATFNKGFALSAWYWQHLLIGMLMVGIALLVLLPADGGAGWQELSMRGIPAAIVVWAALGLEKRGNIVKSAALISIGDASYSMYLTHPFVTQTFEKIGVRLHARGLLSCALMIGCVAAVLLTAQIVHRAVELPVINLVRRWWGGRRVPTSRPVVFRRPV